MRLIDADSLKEKAPLRHGYDFQGVFVKVQDIDTAPTVDAVEVVRCNDCKYRDGACDCTHPDNVAHCYDEEGNKYDIYKMVDGNHFCGYGKHKED